VLNPPLVNLIVGDKIRNLITLRLMITWCQAGYRRYTCDVWTAEDKDCWTA